MPSCHYENFDVTILGASPPYPVSATYRNRTATGQFPHDAGQTIWQTQIASLQTTGNAPGQQTLAQIGGALFDGLITQDVRELWLDATRDLDEDGRLRIRLQINPPAVAALPWELLTDPRRRRILAGDRNVALIRRNTGVAYVSRVRSPVAGNPPRILLAAVNDPGGRNHADEIARVRSELASSHIDLQVMTGPISIHNLRDRTLSDRPDILHIITHGSPDGLLLWNEGEPALVSASQMQALVEQAESLKLVFLNACLAGAPDAHAAFGGVAERLLQSGLPAVVGMQFEILNRPAIAFAATLYQTLLQGPCPGAVDAAVSIARSDLFLEDAERVDYATPVLWLNAEDGVIFRMGAGEATQRSTGNAAADTASSLPAPPPLDFDLAAKEAWFESLPENVERGIFYFDFPQRKRKIEHLLQWLQEDARNLQAGRSLDRSQALERLKSFDEEQADIDHILATISQAD